MWYKPIIRSIRYLVASAAILAGTSPAAADIDWLQALSGAVKAVQATTITDRQVQEYVHQYVGYLDSQNKIAPPESEYSVRLSRLTAGLKDVDGVPLNFKVYMTDAVNAFACADGSVRVYSGLMDLMNDDEVLGVIGHEVGHVAHKDTKKAFKEALLSSALRQGIGSTGGVLGALSNSQLGALGETLVNRSYSKKQESQADDYGYSFLRKSGKNPWSLAMAFRKLESLESKGGSDFGTEISQLFSDHPSTAKRIRHIEQRCRKDHIAPPAGYYSESGITPPKKAK